MNSNKTGKVFTNKFVGTGASSYKKKNKIKQETSMKQIASRAIRLSRVQAYEGGKRTLRQLDDSHCRYAPPEQWLSTDYTVFNPEERTLFSE
jgi:hypothetical protein